MGRKINHDDYWIKIDELTALVVEFNLVPPESKRGRKRKKGTQPEKRARAYIFNRARAGQIPPADPEWKLYPAWVLWALHDFALQHRDRGMSPGELVLPPRFATSHVFADLRLATYQIRKWLSGAAVFADVVRLILNQSESLPGVDAETIAVYRSNLVSFATFRSPPSRRRFVNATIDIRAVLKAGEEQQMEDRGWRLPGRRPLTDLSLPPEDSSQA